MESTKKLLNIAISVSIVLLSLSVFIYSLKDSKAKAAPFPAPEVDKAGYTVVGICNTTSVAGMNVPSVVLYNHATMSAKTIFAYP